MGVKIQDVDLKALPRCLFNTRIADAQWSLFHRNPKLLGNRADTYGQVHFGAFGVFSADLSAPIFVLRVPCPCFPLINHYFYKKNKPYIQILNIYLFGIGIWIWAPVQQFWHFQFLISWAAELVNCKWSIYYKK